MNTLQEYLNNRENKEQLKELDLAQIQQERESQGVTELLLGGALDLREFKALERVKIDPQFLTTPLTKLEVDGLLHLKELDWLEAQPESEEDKKLWEELGISQELNKKRVVKEIQRLAELKGAKVNFKEPEENSIFLPLEQNDKSGNFCPSLMFWNFAQALALMDIGEDKTAKTPEFWKQLEQEKIWVKDNLSENYQKEFACLLNPSTFPTEQLEIGELLSIYYPSLENLSELQEKQTKLDKKFLDPAWQTITQEILTLTNQELENNPEEEKIKELSFKILIGCGVEDLFSQHYTLQINYHPNSPLREKINELITTVPLQLENEELKKEKEQLPTSENFERVTKQNQAWESYVQDVVAEAEFNQIKSKINQIK